MVLFQVFEKRKDPSAAATKIRRSVVFLLTPEVTQLLLDVGIQVPSGKFSNGITAYQHTTITDPSGNVKTFRMQIDNGKRVLTERQCVANAVLQAAVSQKLPNLEFVFESACEDVDVGAKVVRFSNGDGEMEEVPYDLLIGADGANSLVRGALQNSGHVEFTQKKCRQKYICVRDIPASDDLAAEVGVVNFFQAKKKWLEETPVNAVYYRSENNRIQMNFLATEKAFENLKGIESEWTQEAFPPSIPREWRDRIASALQKGDLSTIGPVTYCSSYIGPNIALIGDACHSATPTLGIGANQAILDVKALDGALGKSNGNMEEALQAYDQETRPQVAAIQELEKNHVFSLLEGQDPFWKAFHFIYFQFHRHGSRWLPKVIPPSVFQQLGASAITPKEALEKFCREAFIFSGIVGAAACVAAALGLKAFSGGVV
ncbi:hypothetical protein BSKO_13851 [Bryopsis sp. KO-2023]|nr:hypothetical protein BSKO_13851 [Bryopsis sp. KO-2023]